MASYPDYYLLPIPLVVTTSFAIFVLKNRKMKAEKHQNESDIPYEKRMQIYETQLTGIREDISSIAKILATLSSASFLASIACIKNPAISICYIISIILWLLSIIFVALSFLFSIKNQHKYIKDIANINLKWQDVPSPSDNGQLLTLLISAICFILAYVPFAYSLTSQYYEKQQQTQNSESGS